VKSLPREKERHVCSLVIFYHFRSITFRLIDVFTIIAQERRKKGSIDSYIEMQLKFMLVRI